MSSSSVVRRPTSEASVFVCHAMLAVSLSIPLPRLLLEGTACPTRRVCITLLLHYMFMPTAKGEMSCSTLSFFSFLRSMGTQRETETERLICPDMHTHGTLVVNNILDWIFSALHCIALHLHSAMHTCIPSDSIAHRID